MEYIVNPSKKIIAKGIRYLNNNLLSNGFEYIMRRDPIPIGEIDNWFNSQKVNKELRVICLNDLEDVISIAYLQKNNGRSSHSAKLGVTVAPEQRRQGIGFNACQRIIGIAPTIGISRIEALPVAENKAAIVMLTNLGFHKEGIAKRKFLADNGEYLDCIYMARFI